MIIADDGLGFDSCGDEEINQHGLDLCLAALEVISDQEDFVLIG